MATALTGIYSWVNTELLSLRRAEAVVVTHELTQEALRLIELAPLIRKEQGEEQLGAYRISWSASPAEPSRVGLDGNGNSGLYDVTLFDVVFTIYSDGAQLGEWSVRQLRYQQVRQPQYERSDRL
ncbi:MAG: hypothetical protein AAF662_12770 [Pseudomonadota bacterium]